MGEHHLLGNCLAGPLLRGAAPSIPPAAAPSCCTSLLDSDAGWALPMEWEQNVDCPPGETRHRDAPWSNTRRG